MPEQREQRSRDALASLTDDPETRHYRVRYLNKDTPTADYSDLLVVTVPGKR